MSNDLSLMIRLKGESSDLVNALSKASAQQRTLNGELRATGNSSQVATRGFDHVTKQSDVLTSAVRRAGLAIATYFGVSQLKNMAVNLTGAAGQMQAADVRLRNLTDSSEEYALAQQFVSQTASKQSQDLLVLTQSYSRLLALQKGGIITGAESRLIMLGINDAAAALGATSTQVNQVMYGLSQALASPLVRAEELNQTVESLPGLLQALDKAAGLDPGGFRQMVNDGQITSDMLKTTLIKALNTYEGAAASTYDNINSKIQRNRNEYLETAKALEDPIDDILTPLLGVQSEALQFARENAQELAVALEIAMVAAAGAATSAILRYVIAKNVKINAERADLADTVRSTQADLVAAKNSLASAQAENRKAIALAKSTATTRAYTQSTNRLAASKSALTAATARAAAAEKAHTAAMTASAARGGMLATAGRGLFAAFGGWPGILISSAIALAMYSSSSAKAETSTDKLAASIRSVQEARGMSLGELQADLSKTNTARMRLATEIYNMQRERAALENKVTDAAGQGTGDTTFNSLMRQLDDLNERIADTQAKKDALDKSSTEKGVIFETKTNERDKATIDAEKMRLEQLNKEALKRVENYKAELALLGDTSEAARVRYEIEHGALKEAEEGTKNLLLEKAKELDTEKQIQKVHADAEGYLENLREQANVHNITTELARVRYEIEHGKLQGINEELERRLLNEARLADEARKKEEKKQENQKIETQFTSMVSANENELMTPEQRIAAEYQKRLDLIDQYGQLEIAKTQEIERAKLQAKQLFDKQTEELQRKQLQTQLYAGQQIFEGIAGLAKAFGGEQSAAYKAMFAVSKGFAIAQGVLNLSTAISNAFALPFPTNLPAMATAASEGARLLTTIKGTTYQGQAHDGISRVPAANEGTWMLRRDEMVLNPRQRDNFERLVNRVEGMNSGNSSRAQVIEFRPQIAIDARGASDGIESRLENLVNEMMEQMKQSLYDDFASNGPLSQRLRGNAA
ncbi:tape measure protein [Pseudidiomarina aestuarii]|uniref:tape measure protein n=1 Tax=Pseudidiomarina aestuarii TaxID=624146 RepID=UPI003A976B2D